jgi:hypothetical protein
MPMKLATTLSHLQSIPNIVNKTLLVEFHEYLRGVDTSVNYQSQILKELVSYAEFLGTNRQWKLHPSSNGIHIIYNDKINKH